MSLAACGGGREDAAPNQSAPTVAEGKTVPDAGAGKASPGKPMAPISMSYEVVGNPIIGAPVLINVTVNSSQGPVKVLYSIPDASALSFQQGQVERLELTDPTVGGSQQLSVIPQREGRLFVNVSAEVQTPNGPMIRSMAIPLKVGAAPADASSNGELKKGPDGETVISMPAQPDN